jgi:hypothetical protein
MARPGGGIFAFFVMAGPCCLASSGDDFSSRLRSEKEGLGYEGLMVNCGVGGVVLQWQLIALRGAGKDVSYYSFTLRVAESFLDLKALEVFAAQWCHFDAGPAKAGWSNEKRRSR